MEEIEGIYEEGVNYIKIKRVDIKRR